MQHYGRSSFIHLGCNPVGHCYSNVYTGLFPVVKMVRISPKWGRERSHLLDIGDVSFLIVFCYDCFMWGSFPEQSQGLDTINSVLKEGIKYKE